MSIQINLLAKRFQYRNTPKAYRINAPTPPLSHHFAQVRYGC